MGQQLVYVDTAVLHAVADRFDSSAETITSVIRLRLGRLGFSGASAGRAHVADGDELRRALERWPAELMQWSRASAEIATALRVGAQRYAEAEQQTAAGIG